jgi:HAD superfamily hydrolase (TIGR01509 family)
MTFSAVLIDMDGTLIDSEPQWLESETELMKRFGYDWTPADQTYCLGGPLTKVGVYMHSLVNQESPEFFTNTLIALTEEKLAITLNFMPGALELVDELNELGIPMALVTASPRNLMRAALSALPFEYFTVAISGEDVKRTKPDPEGYLKAAKQLSVPISECLVLEDSLTGVTAALDSGAFVLGIPHFVKLPDHARLRLISTLDGMSANDLLNFSFD